MATALVQHLENICNASINHAADIERVYRPLIGQNIVVKFNSIPKVANTAEYQCVFTPKGLVLFSQLQLPPNAITTVTLQDLVQFKLKQKGLKDCYVSGDQQLLTNIDTLFDSIDIDWLSIVESLAGIPIASPLQFILNQLSK